MSDAIDTPARSPVHPVRGELVSLAQAAKILSLSERTLRDWVTRASGSPIAFRKVEGLYKFDTADIADYLDAAYVPAKTRAVGCRS